MNEAILTPEIQQFIEEHLYDNPTKLLLKYKELNGIVFTEILEQIEAKVRCKKKLPTWFSTKNIYYPNKLNIEQTSSEKTAAYKASLVQGTQFIDITGGFGVDCLAFSKHFDHVTHCEISLQLSQIAAHNYKVLGVSNIKTVHSDGIEYIQKNKQTYDCLYVDPSRRNEAKGKVFLLEDCLPDVVTYQNLLLEKATTLLIKTSPLLDITNGLRALSNVNEVHVVALQNEVKELIWVVNKNKQTTDVRIQTVNLIHDKQEEFSFHFSEESNTEVTYNFPQQYLYEPNAAIMKAGGFSSVAKKYSLKKLHQHSHLYTSQTLISFPGRRFEIVKILPYSKKVIKKELGISKANITTRNFPESVATIRKKLSIADGSDNFLFFTTLHTNQKVVIYCKKV